MPQYTPMMQQYLETKKEYKDCILFYRLGDFYEMFFDDAVTASRELELTLTGKDCGQEERAPMCGIPHHAAEIYISKLISKGYKVAICEQLEDPKATKGMVKRGIVDVISKGTIADNDLLNDKDASYIASILFFNDSILLTILDISTGYLASMSIENNEETLINEILGLNLKEVIFVDNLNTALIDLLKNSGERWEFEPSYEEDIAKEHERWLTNYFSVPVFIKNWPAGIKAYYMKLNEDGKTVAGVDLEVPGAGELIGGSQREEKLDVLLDRMKELGVEEESIEWYVNLRRYGGCIHSGFGMGFERLIMYLTGIENIRDVIPYPRTPGSCEF